MTKLQEIVKRVPFFPLPELVVFPYSLTPLRIFEPRYLKLFSDIIVGSRFLVMAQIKPGYEQDYFGKPPIYDVGCLCYVRDTKLNEREQLMVLVKGIALVKLKQEIETEPYRTGEFDLIREKRQLVASESLPLIHRELWKVFAKTAEYLPDHGERVMAGLRAENPPWMLANVIAANLILDAKIKRKIVQFPNPINRLNYLINLLQEYLEVAHYLRGGSKETPQEPWLN